MYAWDIENRQHRSRLEHRRRQIADVDVVKNSSVVTTTKLLLPPQWLATIEPTSFPLNLELKSTGNITEKFC